jgi:hypothetical protein
LKAVNLPKKEVAPNVGEKKKPERGSTTGSAGLVKLANY